MPAVDIDELFGAGAPLSHDVVVKAKLRVRVHPSDDPGVRAAVDRAVQAYAARLDEVVTAVSGIMVHVDPRRGNAVAGRSIEKGVVRQPFRPGSRGGTWYRDSKGNIRYGVPPEGKFTGYAPQDPPPSPELGDYRPGAFLGGFGRDRELTEFLTDHPDQHELTDNQLRFLGAWYGTPDGGGALFDAFLACAGITRDDVKHASSLRFGSKGMSYEEAVFEFFAAQGPLFMGADPSSPEDEDAWHAVLNDEIKPLIDGVFAKYEEAKADSDVQRDFIDEPARQRRRFLAQARRCRSDVSGVADAVVGDWRPDRVADTVLAGIQAMGLFTRRARADRRSKIHGRPHLRDAVMLDGRVLDAAPGSPLFADGALRSLSASQMIVLYFAAELHLRWDHHTRSYSSVDAPQSGAGPLGDAVLSALAAKNGRWAAAIPAVRRRLDSAVGPIVDRLNAINSHEGYPESGDGGEEAS